MSRHRIALRQVRGARQALVLATLVAARLALAQLPPLPQFDLSRLEVNSSAMGSLVVGTGEMAPPGSLRLSLAVEYENNPLLYFDGTQFVGSVISDRFTLHGIGAWSPMDWLGLGIDVPLVAQAGGTDLTALGIPLPVSYAAGSPSVSVCLGLLSAAKGAPIDAALEVGMKLPIGTDGAWVRDSVLNVAPKLLMGRQLGPLRAGLEVGTRWRAAADASENRVLLAGVLALGQAGGLRAELSGRTSVSFDGQAERLDVLAGLRLPVAGLELFALAGPELGAPQDITTFHVLMGVGLGGAGVAATPSPAATSAASR